MEITCNRCKTEYDFDDALVSDRGTTVRCTNCGDQFKVYRAGASPAPERWIVHRGDGRELVFTDVRDLQRAITTGQVSRHDMLSRGAAPPRSLGNIAELEPLFEPLRGEPSGPPVAATQMSAGATPLTDHLPARSGRTGRPPPNGPAVPPPAAFSAHPSSASMQAAIDPLAHTAHPAQASPPEPYPAPPVRSAAPATRQAPYAASQSGDDIAPLSEDPSQDWLNEPRFSAPSIRSRALKWMVVLVMLGALGVAGATVGRKYWANFVRPPAATQESDGRVDRFLGDGERALDEGDLEIAKESFDKASVLAEHDRRVLLDLARFDGAKADVDWLKLRLLSEGQPDVLAAAKRQAQQATDRALRSADRAGEANPDDPKAIRARIDALRLSGNLAGARSLVGKMGALSAQPETVYVLAALDLAEASPNWSAVIDRLKAAAGESNLPRARAALVYALVRSGDATSARGELEKMSAATHPYPLLPELRAFVSRGPSSAVATDVDAGKRAGPVATAAQATEPRAGETHSEGETPPAGDYRTLVQRASQASSAGDYAKAEQLFRGALAKSPNDTEALAGLGDVARARGNPTLARSYYDRVLAQNPHYLPALTAAADLHWESGDRTGAAKLYRQLLDSAPEGPLTQRARDHIAQVEAAAESKAAKPATAPADRAPAPSPSPARTQPSPPSDIDTSDLPGFKR